MPALPVSDPEAIGFDATRLERAFGMLDSWTESGEVPAAGVCVGRRGAAVAPRIFGRMTAEAESPPVRPDTLFLVASITKPVTVTAAMMLVESGAIALDDRVAEFIPEFGQNGKQDVRLRHLMTHTSGLPDMLPNNPALRAAHAPLSRFIDLVTRLPLAFPPGTQVSYQSMGTAVLADVVRRVAGVDFGEFLRANVFDPLGMADTTLGRSGPLRDRVAAVRLDAGQRDTDWNWNSPYWLDFGAPWGGLITSPADLARFCLMTLGRGTFGGVRLLSPATVDAMTRNQLEAMPGVPEVERRCRPWGLGWRLNWPGRSAHFGDLLGPRAYGHWGATGTLCWLDPDRDAFLILLTTEPAGDEGRYLARFSNAVAAAIV